jgi:hypothetical protein
MLPTLEGERKLTTTILETVHLADLLGREEAMAADPNVQVDMGVGVDAQRYIQTVGDLAHFLDHAQQLGDCLHLLQLEEPSETALVFPAGPGKGAGLPRAAQSISSSGSGQMGCSAGLQPPAPFPGPGNSLQASERTGLSRRLDNLRSPASPVRQNATGPDEIRRPSAGQESRRVGIITLS